MQTPMKNSTFNNYYYKFKFRINIQHSFNDDPHYHTLEVMLYISNTNDDFKKYQVLEDLLQVYVDNYENKYLNDLPSFKELTPTIENIGLVFFTEIAELIFSHGFYLLKLDIGDNPSRTYTVTNFHISGDIFENEAFTREMRIKEFVDSNFERVNDIYQKHKESQKNEPQKDVEILDDQSIHNIFIEEHKNDEVQSYEYIGIDNFKQKVTRRSSILSTIGILYVSIVAALSSIYLSMIGTFPKGKNIYMYLGKAKYLYSQLVNMHFSPIYMVDWYNGYLMFMKSEPISYYLLAFFEWVAKGDIYVGYILLIMTLICLGAYGWISFGRKCNNLFAGVFLGLLWFVIPENLRALTDLGDIQYLVAISFVPYLLSQVYSYLKKPQRFNILKICLVMCIIDLSDFKTALVVTASIFLIFLGKSVTSKRTPQLLKAVVACILSYGFVMVWVYEALVDGNLLSNKTDRTGFYFDIILLIVILASIALIGKLNRYYLISALGLLLISMILDTRFVTMAYASLFIAFISWENCKKSFVTVVMLVIGCNFAFNFDKINSGNDNNLNMSDRIEEEAIECGIKQAISVTNNRILYLDLYGNNTLPAYYATLSDKQILFSNEVDKHATNINDNLEQLKYALYTKNYNYIFDRSIELGCDTILIRKESLRLSDDDISLINESAGLMQYNMVINNDNEMVFHLSTPDQFGTITEYKGIAIGKSARTISVLYPYYEEADDTCIDNYKYEDLKKYDKIYLSGFTYNNIDDAQELVEKLSEAGVEILIDMDSIPVNSITNRQKFLGVTAQTVSFENAFSRLVYNGDSIKPNNFDTNYKGWNTVYIENLDNTLGYTNMGNKKLPFYGTAVNDNIKFLSFNLVYYVLEENDENVKTILNDIVGLDIGSSPEREIKKIYISYNKDVIKINSDYDNINTTIAYQNQFISDSELFKENNLLKVNKGSIEIKFDDMNMRVGLYITVMQIILLLAINKIYLRKRKDTYEK